MNPNKFQITLLTENRLVNHFIKEAIDPDYAILEEITTGKQNWLEDLSNNPPDLLIIRRTLICLLYTSPSPRDLSTSRMPSSA